MVEWCGLGEVMATRAAAAGQEGSSDAHAWFTRADAWRRAFAASDGARWALYLDDTAEFAAALFGAWHAGKHVVLPGDTRAETLAALRAQVDGWAGDIGEGAARGAALQPAPEAAASASALGWSALSTRDTGITLFTSGSTGAPEAIAKRLDQLDAEVHALEQAFGPRVAGARVFSTVSHQHIYGLLFCVLWPLAAGRALPAARLAYHGELIDACLADARPALLVSSPAHLRRMPGTHAWDAVRRTLVAVFSSGGPLPADAAAEATRLLGEAPIEVFGSSETGGIAWRQRTTHGDRWQALPAVSWRLEDGCLAVRSPHLPDSDWFICADRALPAGDDSFVLAGRADRIVKIEEKRVSLTRIEQVLCGSALVREARALLVELDLGTRVAVAVVPGEAGQALLAREGRAALGAALRALLADAVDAVALPRRWAFVPALPCNAQGKTTEAMLRDLFRRTLPQVRWETQEPGADSAAATLEVSADLAIFDGHFPDAPIVPGVAQVDWVMTLAPQRLPIPPRDRFHRIDVLKFQNVIRPGDIVQMALTWQPDTQVLAFRLTSAVGPHASGKILFHPAQP